MGVKTDAPHWSLWQLDRVLPELTLPDEPEPRPEGPPGAWEAGWTIHELDRTKTRSTIDGRLDLSLRAEGGGLLLRVVQDVPLYWRMSIETVAEVRCADDELLSPEAWTVTAVTRTADGELDETRSSSAGSVRGRKLALEGVDRTEHRLPAGALASSWGLLGALPRLHAAGRDRAEFTLLEELLVPRLGQQLAAAEPVPVATAAGAVSLTRWRHLGEGVPPVQYFCGPRGWPLLVCGLRRALVCRYLRTVPA